MRLRPLPLRPAALAMAAVAFGLVTSAGDAEAQLHRYGAGFTTGASWISDLNADAPSDARALSPGVGAFLAIHGDRWYGEDGRIALRYQAAWQQPRFDWTPGERKIDAASADLSVLFRFIKPEEAGAAQPYLAAGAGGIWYNLGRGEPTFFGAADSYHDGSSRVLPTALLALGVDVDFPWQFQRDLVRLRVEVADHLSFGSPLRQSSTEERHGPVHHLRFSVGLYSALDFPR